MKGRDVMVAAVALTGIICAGQALAEQAPPDPGSASAAAELAKKIQNPVANLISVPVKLDWDTGIGSTSANRSTYVVQPVIPFSLNKNWNIISRTITPFFIDAQSPAPGVSSSSGLGDILQSFFFSPVAPTSSGWIWGAGPAVSLPTASKDALGSGKVSVGPTAVLLKQEKGWTYGVLANYLHSVAGDGSRATVSSTFWQPFVSYTTKKFTAFGLNTESTYNFETSQWTVPVNATVSQLLKIRGQVISVLLGYRYYVTTPTGGPNHGFRLQVTFIFPR
jgi:hypothetical protein